MFAKFRTFLVNINHGKKILRVHGGVPLLQVLTDANIFLPSACGGRGSCGSCTCITTTPKHTFHKEQTDKVLACQHIIRSHLNITVPDNCFNVQRLNCTVDSIISVTPDIIQISFKLPNNSNFEFVPGQYAQFIIPPHATHKKSSMRAYSFCSPTTEKETISILVRLIPEGIVSSFMHNQLHIGQQIEAIAPLGDFHLRQTNATMVCVAGGSGLSPFRSILSNMQQDGSFNNRDVWLFFGAKNPTDLFWLDWFQALEQQFPRFHFVPCLSEPRPSDNWQGETGNVVAIVRRYLKTKIEIVAPREGYLCGSPGMIQACISAMQESGIDNQHIYYDAFS